MCGVPCKPCVLECELGCKHNKCEKLCFEICNHKPCEHPCDKKLSCGHPCIGYCGDFCPFVCAVKDCKLYDDSVF